jgi:general secretion pathway protein G
MRVYWRIIIAVESGMKSKLNQGVERRRSGGFTLIEILIVIVIMGLLIALVAPTMFSKVSSSQRKTTMAQMQMISTALDTYRLDIGSYPDKLEELRRSDRPGWDGPYLPRDIPADPWGNPYVYSVTGDRETPYRLSSYAAGGSPDGEDDEADIVFQ